MRRARPFAAAGLLTLLATLAPAAPAGADFGPIRLVSKTVPEQAREAKAPALSADGRYVAFRATMEGQEGIFREDLETGAVERVATGSAAEAGADAGAEAPSISADGRYVSFTTRAALDPADDTRLNSRDVYVADMSSSPPTYELASAEDGSTRALPGGGIASPRVALSADGRKVAFVSEGQVYLRDLETDQTTLVSVARDPLTGTMEPGVPVPGGAVLEDSVLPLLTGAALSADGTTVAWIGTDLPAQVPLLADEREAISEADAGAFPYDEPLWRRVADGPLAPTRRIVGGGDPLAPGCPGTSGTLAEPACRGPFPGIDHKNTELNQAVGWLGLEHVDGIPQLSADGREVALIGNPNEGSDVFLVDMREGLSRVQAVRPLTQFVALGGEERPLINTKKYIPLDGHVFDLAISPDGRQIALATARQRFPLAPPNLVSRPPTELGLVELYLIDLETESLERLTHGYKGESEPSLGSAIEEQNGHGVDIGAGATSPSFGADGRLIAFASTAPNLVEGDGNEASDVFTIEGSAASGGGGEESISAPPAQLKLRRRHRLALRAFSLPDGGVRLLATAPGPGTLRARVTAALEVGAPPRRLAGGRARTRGGRPATMILTLPSPYRRLARAPGGVYATARVSFQPLGDARPRTRPLRGELEIRFRVHPRHRGGRR